MKRVLVLAMLISGGLISAGAWACVALGRDGILPIKGEEALIVWDSKTHTEHFIRRAAFDNAPADFGFLVPTPSKPTIAEAPSRVFARLFDLYKMPPPPEPSSDSKGPQPSMAVMPEARTVQVVEQKRVAGLDASVLRASDAGALATWLKAHNYPSSPALTTWLAPYVARGAYVTAFKLAGGAHASTGAVRMSFTTDEPEFPYSEPPSKMAARPFRISVIANKRVSAKVGDKAWDHVAFAAPVTHNEMRALLDGAVPVAAQGAGWITTFDEPYSVRGADDLHFSTVLISTHKSSTISTRIDNDKGLDL